MVGDAELPEPRGDLAATFVAVVVLVGVVHVAVVVVFIVVFVVGVAVLVAFVVLLACFAVGSIVVLPLGFPHVVLVFLVSPSLSVLV